MTTRIGRPHRARHIWEPPADRPEDLSHARAWVRTVLHEMNRDDLIDDAKLVLTELGSNAKRHGGGIRGIAVTAYNGGTLEISVEDGNHLPPELVRDPADAQGRGLLLVTALTARWYAELLPDGGKRVSAILAVETAYGQAA